MPPPMPQPQQKKPRVESPEPFSFSPTSVLDFNFAEGRVRTLTKATGMMPGARSVLYWMSRDQRVQDNWALIYAQRVALQQKLPLLVAFCLVPKFLDAALRQYDFMLRGLEEVQLECQRLRVQFGLLLGQPDERIPQLARSVAAGCVVCDFSPLRVPLRWAQRVAQLLPEGAPLLQVDAHNIVPVWAASDKQEYAARTIRPKIHARMQEYCTEFPQVLPHPHQAEFEALPPPDWQAARDSLQVDTSVGPVSWAQPGFSGGAATLREFVASRLSTFGSGRNDPNSLSLSQLSPWLHFGQIAAQRAVLEVRRHRQRCRESVDAFVEEAVVRRELADNFCFYNGQYDSLQAAPQWAQQTLAAHAGDKRAHVYTQLQLQEARTHDELWNAAQLQMVREGKMHGFLRMYWAKKILEWTPSPEEALRIAIFLNDKFSIDGRDPNGYVGCAWSVCGVHDQGWAEREIFGKVRYMNYKGCQRKFDVAKFVAKYRRSAGVDDMLRQAAAAASEDKQDKKEKKAVKQQSK